MAHSIKNEPVALQEYEKFMFNRKTPVAVLKRILVVAKSYLVQMSKLLILDVLFVWFS